MRAILLGGALAALSAGALLSPADAQQRPFRGTVGVSVLLCKYNGEPDPAKDPEFYEDMAITPGTGGHADFWSDTSYGSIDMRGSVVRGWYEMDQTEEEGRAYGGGGSPQRGQKHRDCVDKAIEEGYTPPDDHIVIVMTSPGIDTFGFGGGSFLGENARVGVMSHEVGHGLNLRHSFSDDLTFQSATWSAPGEYDDKWDTMSYGNVYKKVLGGDLGRGGPGLNAYHRDRMGWLRRGDILRFGADGRADREVTLRALDRDEGAGYAMVRIPFDPQDPYRYLTVEYRRPAGWDGGIPDDTVLIHEVKPRPNGPYVSWLLRDASATGRPPLQSVERDGISIDVLSTDPGAGTAQVRIRSNRVDWCVQGFVWREARPSDHVCVTPARRSAVREENRLADSRRQPGGGAYGPDTCRQGYVWREAYRDDHVCVPPASRTTARQENRLANSRRLAVAAYGPNTCKQGFVWREADQRDWVCVTPQRRAQVREQNRLAASRRQPGGGAYGPDTCRQGYVWRDAFPGDHVCVPPASRRQVREENETANERLAKRGA